MTSRIGLEINGFKILSSRTVHTEKSKNTVYTVQCLNCGRLSEKRSGDVMRGKAKCYCAGKCKLHGKSKTRLYRIYNLMKSRTQNPNNQNYDRYGARGIKICDDWLADFSSFYDWAIENGYSDELTIDRIDNDKGYCPENCRWITRKEQARNTSFNRRLEFDGQNLTLGQWSEKLGIPIQTINYRLSKNFPVEDVLSKEKLTKTRKQESR